MQATYRHRNDPERLRCDTIPHIPSPLLLSGISQDPVLRSIERAEISVSMQDLCHNGENLIRKPAGAHVSRQRALVGVKIVLLALRTCLDYRIIDF